MAPAPAMAPRHVQVENCAAWHVKQADFCERAATREQDDYRRRWYRQEAERHDMLANLLFKEARELAAPRPKRLGITLNGAAL